MGKRYQVFVSSTFEDLQVERQEVMQALLELDCIPAGMELFPAANEDQWTTIKKVIDDCDYYIVILAGRYGSLGKEGTGYTEMEYRYDLDQGKPTIAFLHKDPDSLPVKRTEKTPEGQKRLTAFRELLQSKLCKMWSTPTELGSVVSRSLVQLIKSHPAIGWIRGDAIAQTEAMTEILQLRKKVEQLEAELSYVMNAGPPGSEDLAQGEEAVTLSYSFEAADKKYNYTRYKAEFATAWNAIFASVSPLLIHELSEARLQQAVNAFVTEQNFRELRKSDALKGMELDEFELNQEDFQTIKIQFRALGLITQNVRPRSVKDRGTYWTLTPYGDAVMTKLRAIRRGRNKSDRG
ncbi:MAG TPA: DUF4062 domain-containing protein [Desulfomonilaceae bacterium]|nr:DUF4062 domain-containing protein [Desulfomonilaceae bacterium]